jgi:hypothetical protein
MPSIRSEDLTPFGRLALKLDHELTELSRAGEQISKVDLESDGGMDDGIKILNRVAQYGQSVAQTMQDFSAALQQARDGAEAATKVVAERAQVIKQRRQEQDLLEEQLTRLKATVREAGASLAGFAKPPEGVPSEEDRKRIAAELEKVMTPMNTFIEAAQAIKARAARGKFKRLERQTDAMIDSLQASRKKISQALPPK